MNSSKDFAEIEFNNNERPVFSYRSGLAVFEEAFDAGRLVSLGANAAGYMQNVLEIIPSYLDFEEFRRPQSFHLEVDGSSLDSSWEFTGFEKTSENGFVHGKIGLFCKSAGIRAVVHTVLDSTAVAVRYITVKNESGRSVKISGFSPISGGVEIIRDFADYGCDEIYSLGYFDSSYYLREGLFRWHTLPNAGYSFSGKFTRARHRHPAFFLRNNLSGEILSCQLAWSGAYDFRFELNLDESDARLSFDAALDGQKPLSVLSPDEEFRFPEIHIGLVHGSLDDAVNEMHRHTRKSVFTFPDARGLGSIVECGLGAEHPLGIENIRHFADTAEKIGAEALIVDAGWYCDKGRGIEDWGEKAGDWFMNKTLYPNGFDEARDYIHSKGLLFGLWVEPERLGPLSAEFAKGHKTIKLAEKGNRDSGVLDLTDSAEAEWMEKEICRVIDEYKVDLFRLDYNIDNYTIDYVAEKDGISCCGALGYYAVLYSVFERLRKKYPDVVFENCAGGGARTDLGMLKNFQHTWVSDNQVLPRAVAITNGMTMVLPPERVDRLASGMGGHATGSFALQVRQILFGRPTFNSFNPDGSAFNPNQIDFVRHSVDIFKKYIRPYAADGLIFHHTPEIYGEQPRGLAIMERCGSDRACGVIGVFALSNEPEQTVRVKPKGIDASKKYSVTFDNTGASAVVDGFELINSGIAVSLPSSLSSELIIYSAV